MGEAIGLHAFEKLWNKVREQNQRQEKLDKQLQLIDERQREFDKLEDDYQKKKHEILMRYNERLHALETQALPALQLLPPGQSSSALNSPRRQLHAAEHGADAAPNEATAAAASQPSLYEALPRLGEAAENRSGLMHASRAEDDHVLDGQHDDLPEPAAAAPIAEPDKGEVSNSEVEADDEAEQSVKGVNDQHSQLHVVSHAAAQHDASEPCSPATSSGQQGTGTSEQGNSEGGNEQMKLDAAEDAEALGPPEDLVGTSMGAKQDIPRGRLDEEFYVFREPRSLPEARKRKCGWPRHLWDRLDLQPPLEPPAVTQDALAPWRTRLKFLKTDLEEFAEDDNGPYGWAYLLGREGLSLQQAEQKLMKKRLWQGFAAVQDVTSYQGSDEEEDSSSEGGFQVVSGALPGDGEAQSSETEESDQEMPVWGEMPGDEGPELEEDVLMDEDDAASEEDLLWEDDSMQLTRDRVIAAIRALLAAGLLQGEHAESVLKEMAGRIAAIAKDLLDKQQWGHARVLTPAILGRIAMALEIVKGALAEMSAAWYTTKSPQLEQCAYKVWRLGRLPLKRQRWAADQAHAQGRLLDLVEKALEAHIGSHAVPRKALRRACKGLEPTMALILELDFQLRTAALPNAPPRLERAAKRKELGAERDGQDAGADGDVSVADSLGSWLASEDEEDGQNEHMPADGGADMAGAAGLDAGRHLMDDGIEGESLHSSSEADGKGEEDGVESDEEGEESGEGEGRTWNAAGLPVGATEVFGKKALPGSIRQQEDDVEQQQKAALQEEAAQAEDAHQAEVAASDQGLNAEVEASGAAAAAAAAANTSGAAQETSKEGPSSLMHDSPSVKRNLLKQVADAPVPEGATVGEPSDGPIVLDDSDEDVDVETVDDFAEGADVEVRKNGATPWAGEAWSPGRVRRSARLALTVEIQDPDGEGGPTLKEVQRPVVAAPSPIRPKPPASYAVRDPLQVSAGDVLDCSVRLKVRSKIVTAVRRCVVLRVVPPRLSRTALKALATLRKSPDACSLSKISALLLGLSAGQNPDTTEKPDTWKALVYVQGVPQPHVIDMTKTFLQNGGMRFAMEYVLDDAPVDLTGPTLPAEGSAGKWVHLDAAVARELREKAGIVASWKSKQVLNRRTDRRAALHLESLAKQGYSDEQLGFELVRAFMARHPDCPFTDARKVIGLDPPKKRTVLPNKFDVPQNLIGVRRQALAALPIGGGCGRRKKRGRPPVQELLPEDRRKRGAQAAAKTREQNQRQERDKRTQAILEGAQAKRRRCQAGDDGTSDDDDDVGMTDVAAPAELRNDADAYPLFDTDKQKKKRPDSSPVLVAGKLAKALKPHQWAGVRFMWKNVVDGQNEEDEGRGCILAHAMGLGKSIQTIALLHTYHAYFPGHRSLLIVPANVLGNWKEEFSKWIPPALPGSQQLIDKRVTNCYKAKDVRKWSATPNSCMIIGYELFASLTAPVVHKAKKRQLAAAAAVEQQLAEASQLGQPSAANGVIVQPSALQNGGKPQKRKKELTEEEEAAAKDVANILLKGADVVVADEAHILKSTSTNIYRACKALTTEKRVALTGYPLQNNLNEYYHMLFWAQGDFGLGSIKEFKENFGNPIMKGQEREATREQKRDMYKQLSVLQMLVRHYVQRFGDEILTRELPPKREHILLLRLSPLQRRLYAVFMRHLGVDTGEEGKGSEGLSAWSSDSPSLFRDFHLVRVLCDRPHHFIEDMRLLAAGSNVDIPMSQQDAGTPDEEMTLVPTSPDPKGTQHTQGATQVEGAATQAPSQEPGAKVLKGLSQGLAQELVRAADEFMAAAAGQPNGEELTGRFWVARQIIQKCLASNEQLVIFSEHLANLDDIASLLKKMGLEEDEDFKRITGKVAARKRQVIVNDFNRPKSPYKVLLISTKAGALGINLVSASHMIILGQMWNPVHHAQAIARIFRYGQTWPTYIYSLVYQGTMEEACYRRNVDKEGLAQKVIDKRTVKGMVSEEDTEMYRPIREAAPAAPDELTAFVIDAMDNVLETVLSADIEGPRWVLKVEDHTKNLPPDPEQALDKEAAAAAAQEFGQRLQAEGGLASPNKEKGRSRGLRRIQQFILMEDSDSDFEIDFGLSRTTRVTRAGAKLGEAMAAEDEVEQSKGPFTRQQGPSEAAGRAEEEAGDPSNATSTAAGAIGAHVAGQHNAGRADEESDPDELEQAEDAPEASSESDEEQDDEEAEHRDLDRDGGPGAMGTADAEGSAGNDSKDGAESEEQEDGAFSGAESSPAPEQGADGGSADRDGSASASAETDSAHDQAAADSPHAQPASGPVGLQDGITAVVSSLRRDGKRPWGATWGADSTALPPLDEGDGSRHIRPRVLGSCGISRHRRSSLAAQAEQQQVPSATERRRDPNTSLPERAVGEGGAAPIERARVTKASVAEKKLAKHIGLTPPLRLADEAAGHSGPGPAAGAGNGPTRVAVPAGSVSYATVAYPSLAERAGAHTAVLVPPPRPVSDASGRMPSGGTVPSHWARPAFHASSPATLRRTRHGVHTSLPQLPSVEAPNEAGSRQQQIQPMVGGASTSAPQSAAAPPSATQPGSSQGLRVDAKDAPRTDVGTTGPRFAGLKWPATMYLAPSAPAAAQAAAVLPAAAAAAGSNAATAGQGGPVRSRPASQLEAAFEAILRAGRSGGSMAAAAAEWARGPQPQAPTAAPDGASAQPQPTKEAKAGAAQSTAVSGSAAHSTVIEVLDRESSESSNRKRAKVYQPPPTFGSPGRAVQGQKIHETGSGAPSLVPGQLHKEVESGWRSRMHTRSPSRSREATPHDDIDVDILVDLTQ